VAQKLEAALREQFVPQEASRGEDAAAAEGDDD
jgi:hypothetical protein